MPKFLWKTLALATLTLAAACSERRNEPSVDPRIALSDQFTGDYALIDQNGRPRSDEDFRGKVAIIYFGFATCPDVCPMALGRLSAALNELSARDRGEIVPIFITTDPERDTPERLRAFLAFDTRITGLTGSPEAAEAARAAFKVYAVKVPLEGSAAGYTMNHSGYYYVVDREGRPRFALDDGLPAAEFAEVLRTALRAHR